MDTLDHFAGLQYTLRRKVFKLFGAEFTVFDEHENVVMYCKQKAFKLKEDIRLFTDESMQTPLLSIHARNVIDFSATYDIIDAQTQELLGSCQRKGLESMLRDAWEIWDPQEQVIATLQEDSAGLAAMRRFLDVPQFLAPQSFDIAVNGRTIASMHQNRNPFVQRLVVDFSQDRDNELDPRVGLAVAVLVLAIEGRQD